MALQPKSVLSPVCPARTGFRWDGQCSRLERVMYSIVHCTRPQGSISVRFHRPGNLTEARGVAWKCAQGRLEYLVGPKLTIYYPVDGPRSVAPKPAAFTEERHQWPSKKLARGSFRRERSR